jgi:glyoxylate utilization-related uncharacterized protein
VTAFERRLIQLEPGDLLHHGDTLWQDAIVFVIAGELAVECSRGERHCFRSGDVLTLARLPICRAHNSGAAPTRLLAIRRADAATRSPVSLGPADRHTEKDDK